MKKFVFRCGNYQVKTSKVTPVKKSSWGIKNADKKGLLPESQKAADASKRLGGSQKDNRCKKGLHIRISKTYRRTKMRYSRKRHLQYKLPNQKVKSVPLSHAFVKITASSMQYKNKNQRPLSWWQKFTPSKRCWKEKNKPIRKNLLSLWQKFGGNPKILSQQKAHRKNESSWIKTRGSKNIKVCAGE